jgi:hypothetical protein
MLTITKLTRSYKALFAGAAGKTGREPGIMTTETRVLDPFSAIEVRGDIHLRVKHDQAQSIRLFAGANVLPQVITEVDEKGLLVIRTSEALNKTARRGNGRICAFVCTPGTRRISANGAEVVGPAGAITPPARVAEKAAGACPAACLRKADRKGSGLLMHTGEPING